MNFKKSWKDDKIRLGILNSYFKDIALVDISPLMIQRFITWRIKEGNRKSTVNRYLALLKKMFNLAIEENYLSKNPAAKIKLFSEKDNLKERILSGKEEEELLLVAAEHLIPIIKVALNTGMRLGEILNLKWNQVNLKSMMIRVENTKSGRTREIPINPLLYDELQDLKGKDHAPYLFFNPKTGKPLTTVKTAFKAACRRSGIKELRFHDLRHTFASRLVENGVDIETVRSLTGHSSYSITQRYVHSTDDRKRKAVQLLNKKPNERTQKTEKLLHIRDMDKNKQLEKQVIKLPTHLFSWN